jgi:hypothetical protein
LLVALTQLCVACGASRQVRLADELLVAAADSGNLTVLTPNDVQQRVGVSVDPDFPPSSGQLWGFGSCRVWLDPPIDEGAERPQRDLTIACAAPSRPAAWQQLVHWLALIRRDLTTGLPNQESRSEFYMQRRAGPGLWIQAQVFQYGVWHAVVHLNSSERGYTY